jgi:hypothetical protein
VRTTLDIDDDILEAATALAHKRTRLPGRRGDERADGPASRARCVLRQESHNEKSVLKTEIS